MFFSLFGSASVDAFGKVLAQDFIQRFPPDLEKKIDKHAKRKLENAEKELYLRALKFHREKGLGFFRKAALANAIRWELKSKGFSDVFVHTLTRNLIMQLARRKT